MVVANNKTNGEKNTRQMRVILMAMWIQWCNAGRIARWSASTSEVVLCPILYCIDVFSTYLGKILDFIVVHWSFIFVSHVSWLIVEFI